MAADERGADRRVHASDGHSEITKQRGVLGDRGFARVIEMCSSRENLQIREAGSFGALEMMTRQPLVREGGMTDRPDEWQRVVVRQLREQLFRGPCVRDRGP